MKVTYDPEVDVMRILFSNAPIEESDEDKPGIILDYDEDGTSLGLRYWTPRSRSRILGPLSMRSRIDRSEQS